jgi:DNA-binding beta-propeller fold protein YncE
MIARRSWCVAMVSFVVALALVFVCAVSAWASYEEVGRFATPGSVGELALAEGVAVDYASGDVYLADEYKSRVSKFDSQGGFLGAWGWNVTATGPDKAGVDHVEKMTVKAAAGKFILDFPNRGELVGELHGVTETNELPFDASAALVQSELNALSRTKERGGRFKVEGGPGDETGSAPYTITYEGAIGDESTSTNVESIDVSLGGGSPSTIVETEAVNNGAPAFEDCVVANGDVCRTGGVHGEGVGQFNSPAGVAVDQSTGDVYVLDGARKQGMVQVFSADGVLIGSFGEEAVFGELVSANPGKIERPTGIAVDSSGDVYVVDVRHGGGPESRVMVFTPEAGSEYKKYVYAGWPHDIAVGTSPGLVAVDPSNGDVYVSNEKHVYRFAAGSIVTPACESQEFLKLGGIAVKPGGGVFVIERTHLVFYELDASCEPAGEFPGVAGEQETHALAFNPGLSFGVARPDGVLYALNSEKPNTGIIFARPPVFPPSVDGESVSGVGSASVRLEALVSPHGYDTSYRFQYGTEDCAASACAEAPVGGAVLGTGQADLTAAVNVGGLQPETTYHYRVLASNAFGTVEGADATFTTFPLTGTGLPDGRVYELVSPMATDGGEVFAPDAAQGGSCYGCRPGGIEYEMMPMQSAPDGDSVVYEGGPFFASGDAVHQDEYLATRTMTGWRTRAVSPPLAARHGGFEAFSPDLSRSVFSQDEGSLTPDAPVDYANLYAQESASPEALTPLVGVVPPDRSPGATGANKFSVSFAGASADLTHVFFEANDALTGASAFAPEAQYGGGATNLYESVGGQLRLVNVLPGNTGTAPGAVFGSGGRDRVASSDGSRVFWSYGGHVYVRVNGESTVEIPDPSNAGLLTIGSDGSKALFDDGQIYDFASETSSDLTEGHGGFQGILGASEDLTHVYFVDTSVLAANANENSETAVEGKLNLYGWKDGTTVFIGRLLAGDNGTFELEPAGDWRSSSSERTAQVTPDGHYLAFISEASLTGYDNRLNSHVSGGCSDVHGALCYEVFEYDSLSGRLACASCNPTGVRPVGDSYLSLITPLQGSLFPQPRNLSDDGRVFFDSLDTLSPYDINGRVGDVYEYEPDDIGSCTRVNGCIFMISSGHDTSDSNFVAADSSGENVFFTTRSRLVSGDVSDLYKLYDARLNGGFAEVTPPACTGTGCQGVPGSPPIFATPSSVTFTGVGNYTGSTGAPANKPKTKTVKCAKGKRLIRGRCVKAKAKKAKRTRRAQKSVLHVRRRVGGAR